MALLAWGFTRMRDNFKCLMVLVGLFYQVVVTRTERASMDIQLRR